MIRRCSFPARRLRSSSSSDAATSRSGRSTPVVRRWMVVARRVGGRDPCPPPRGGGLPRPGVRPAAPREQPGGRAEDAGPVRAACCSRRGDRYGRRPAARDSPSSVRPARAAARHDRARAAVARSAVVRACGALEGLVGAAGGIHPLGRVGEGGGSCPRCRRHLVRPAAGVHPSGRTGEDGGVSRSWRGFTGEGDGRIVATVC
jgi:hypothetical protein